MYSRLNFLGVLWCRLTGHSVPLRGGQETNNGPVARAVVLANQTSVQVLVFVAVSATAAVALLLVRRR